MKKIVLFHIFIFIISVSAAQEKQEDRIFRLPVRLHKCFLNCPRVEMFEDSTELAEYIKIPQETCHLFTWKYSDKTWIQFIRDRNNAKNRKGLSYFLHLTKDDSAVKESLSNKLLKKDLELLISRFDKSNQLDYTSRERYINSDIKQLQNNLLITNYYRYMNVDNYYK